MKNRIVRGLLLPAFGLSLLVTLGCGKSEPTPAPSGGGGGYGGAPAPAAAPAAKKKWDPAAGTATVSGVVSFKGTPAARGKIDMSGNAECAECNKGAAVLDEDLIVTDGKIKNAFVWVKKGLEGWEFEAPATPVTVDQHNCMYTPHVIGIQVGQKLLAKNSDGFKHNVNLVSQKQGKPFNPMQDGGKTDEYVFDAPEFCTFKCNIHSWMTSRINVVEHPFFGVTGDDGKFTLPGLPPGKYTVEAWHEHFKAAKRMEIEIKDKETKGDVNFEFEEK
ncbi:MAG: TonB-dependent receptor [Planctomycetes bacterium]|nr:TonB-dependent receptor [Planctomycetota bacterium]